MGPLAGLFAGVDVARWFVWAAVIASAATAVWTHGFHRGERKLFEYQADQAKAAIPVVVRQGAVTERVVTRFRERLVVLEAETRFLEKEVVRYVPPAADPVLPRGWVQLHDAAATRSVPPAPGGVDVSTPAIAASEAIEGVVRNYGACHANVEQLLALQAWVRHQYETTNQQPLGY